MKEDAKARAGRRSYSTPRNQQVLLKPRRSVQEPRDFTRFATASCTYQNDASKFIHKFPKIYHQRINYVHNVGDDGNCGFRAIAKNLNMSSGEKSWSLVRSHMLNELNSRSEFFIQFHGGINGYMEVYKGVEHKKGAAGPTNGWISLSWVI